MTELEEALENLARYGRKEELEELPGELSSVAKQMQSILHTGGRYEVVVEEGEDGARVTVYTLRRSRRLGTSKYPGWERTKKLAELELSEEEVEAVKRLSERVEERLS